MSGYKKMSAEEYENFDWKSVMSDKDYEQWKPLLDKQAQYARERDEAEQKPTGKQAEIRTQTPEDIEAFYSFGREHGRHPKSRAELDTYQSD